MADSDSSAPQTRRMPRFSPSSPVARLVLKLREHAPNSRQLIDLLALLISGTVLLLLTGLTVTVTVIAFVLFALLIIISSPIWVPLGIFFFVAAAAIFSTCWFGVAVVACSSWIYKFCRGYNRSGNDRVDSAINRAHDTASHLKAYAVEYGKYLQNKVKDTAPGA